MEEVRTRKILERISEVSDELSEARRVRREILASGSASASLSSGGGSKSYTRLDIDKITALIHELNRELSSLRGLLSGSGGLRIGRIMTIRS